MKNKNKLIITMILVFAVIGIFAFSSINITGNVAKETQKTKEIIIDAVRFKYTPNIITLKEGEKIKLIINNIDTPHGIRIPKFNVQGESGLEFTPDKKGEFDFYCLIPCGKSHMQMKGKLIIN